MIYRAFSRLLFLGEEVHVYFTKLDGSAKGGIVFAIETELCVPVKLVGLGETVSDLAPFVPGESVDALFEVGDGTLPSS